MEEVRESSSYDNYLDTDNRIQDDYKATLDKYVGEELTTALPDKVLTREEKAGVHKVLYVHFRNVDDMAEYCSLIGQCIDHKTKVAFYPQADPETSLFGEEEEPTGIKIDKNLLLPRSKNKSDSALDIEVKEGVTDVNACLLYTSPSPRD